jgi:N-acetylglucosaminyldiphosphoundecaprenol N-acetyl-beta-D-mannosaminyltransferase
VSVVDQANTAAKRQPGAAAPSERILGISFFKGTALEAVEHFRQASGYLVAPAAPALLKLRYDEEYRHALQQADMAIPDSGLLVWAWKLAGGETLTKISGIAYLRCLLENFLCDEGKTFWVVSSESAKVKASRCLIEKGFHVEEEDFHVAQDGGKTEDYSLLLKIEKLRPRDIVIAIGTGTQEKLGLYLRDYLQCQPRPRIHCIGAALGFLTGDQPPISDWADKHHFGWLARVVSQPRLLLPRIGIALALVRMILKYRSELPPLRKRWTEM